MDNSRPSSPDAPPQDLWSSILDSVSSSRSIPSKQIILLGEPSSGKSTLVSALLQKPPPEETKEDQRTDFAIGYDWADVRDDADEGVYASTSVTCSYKIERRCSCRYPCSAFCVQCTFLSTIIFCIAAPLRASQSVITTFPRNDCA